MAIEDLITYGRLHFVIKKKKEFPCRICKKVILIGSECYSQHIKYPDKPFPDQSRICLPCASKLILEGTEIVLPKKLKEVNIK